MEKKILLIDDDRDIHEQVRIIMNKAGYHCISAYGGGEGLNKIITENPDIIILDFMMPDKNGTQTFKDFMNISKYQEYRNIPVIMLTGVSHTQDDIKSLLESGLNAYLEKPFGHRELLNIIENTFVTNAIKIRNIELNAAIVKSKNFLENLIASCPVIIITTDCRGNITFISKAVEEILGYFTDNLRGKPLNLLLSSENIYKDILNRITPTTPLVQEEFKITSKTRKIIPIGMTFSHLKNFKDEILGLLVVGQDLSDQKRLEKELVERKRLEAITESLATINHQINNPLTPILGNLQLIRRDENSLSDNLSKKLDIIESNAKRIFNIIQKFNQISKPVIQKYYGEANIIDIHN